MSALAILIGVIVWRVASEILEERQRNKVACSAVEEGAEIQRGVPNESGISPVRVEPGVVGEQKTEVREQHSTISEISSTAPIPVPTMFEPDFASPAASKVTTEASGGASDATGSVTEARRGISLGCAIGSLVASVAAVTIPGPDWTWIAVVLPALALLLGAVAVVSASPRGAP
jgi:hypothetical protein